jgi:hypothetical protein
VLSWDIPRLSPSSHLRPMLTDALGTHTSEHSHTYMCPVLTRTHTHTHAQCCEAPEV